MFHFKTTIQELQKRKLHTDQIDVDLIIAHVIGKSREFLIAHPEMKLGLFDYLIIRKLLKKRAKGIPLAYLTGHKEFYGLDFEVNEHTLVPRPDTEIMVEETLYHLTTLPPRQLGVQADHTILIDVGTGSGCIPISIIKNLSTKTLEHLNTFATDISKPAIRIAKKNAKKHNVNITFLHSSILEPILKLKPKLPKTSHLIITANLPYLTEEQFQNEPSIQHEPMSALVANDHGLALYEELLKQVKQLLSTLKTFRLSTYFEIDPSQTQRITKLIKTYLPTSDISIKKDLAGRDRIVKITI